MSLAVAFELVLLAAFAALYALATTYPERARQFPQLIALVSMALIAVGVVQSFVGRKSTRARAVWDRERAKRAALAWGVILLATALGFVGGFLVSVLLFFLGFAFFFGKPDAFWRHAVIAVGVTAVIWVVFERIMGVPLLGGVLW